MSVLTGHMVCAYGLPPCLAILIGTPFRALWHGQAAVEFFFVLSGFVLSVPYFRSGKVEMPSIPAFAVQRVFRVYPAFWGALLLGAAAKWMASLGVPNSSLLQTQGWWATGWNEPASIWRVFREAWLVSWRGGEERILNQDWSLWIEVTFSIFVPVFAVICRRQMAGFLILVPCLVFFLGAHPTFLSFAAGTFIARIRGEWCAWWCKGPIWLKLAFAILGPVLYTYETSLNPAQAEPLRAFMRHPETFGAAMVLLTLLGSRKLQTALHFKPLVAIGHLSYGIYLVHGIVILTVVPWLVRLASICGMENSSVAWFMSVIGAVGVSSLIAWPLRQWVELPANRFGKRMAASIKESSTDHAAGSVEPNDIRSPGSVTNL